MDAPQGRSVVLGTLGDRGTPPRAGGGPPGMLEGMDDYTAEADKLFIEVDHLERVLEDPDLALSVAKKVRRASTLLVRAIARHRDNVHAQEGDNE